MLLNPAQAGAQHDMRSILNYKSQWSSVAIPYTTANFSWDMRISKKKNKTISAIGFNVYQDKAGNSQLKTLQLSAAYACHIKLNDKSTLGAGAYAGMLQRNISMGGLQWLNQYDGNSYNASIPSGEPTGGSSLIRFDAGAGLHYEYNKNEKYMTGNDYRKFSAGASVFHLNQPAYSFYGKPEKLSFKINGYANAEFGFPNSNISMIPGIIYSLQGRASELMAGTMFQYQLKSASKYTGFVQSSSVSFGGYYRFKDAFIVSTLFKLAQYSICLSYDVNVSGLRNASTLRGGFEISLRFVNVNPQLSKVKPKG